MENLHILVEKYSLEELKIFEELETAVADEDCVAELLRTFIEDEDATLLDDEILDDDLMLDDDTALLDEEGSSGATRLPRVLNVMLSPTICIS